MTIEREPDGRTLAIIRTLLLALLTLGMLGTAADLLLLQHYEDFWQTPPLVLISVALVLLALIWTGASRGALVTFACLMSLFIMSGIAGILLHYSGNLEFQREIDPAQHGWPLFMAVMRAKAPPALAPAVMIQLGLLGLLYVYRHPALTSAAPPTRAPLSKEPRR
jgi:hypothetical protein